MTQRAWNELRIYFLLIVKTQSDNDNFVKDKYAMV